MRRFYLILALINVGCFLPLYLLNARTAPNPFRLFLIADRSRWAWLPRLMYMRIRSTDPFRIQFDFTFFVLLAVGAAATGSIARIVAATLLASGFIEIFYTSAMYGVFRRMPALASDLSLLRAGIGLARRQMWWMAPLTALGLLGVWLASVSVVSLLFDADAGSSWSALALAAVLLPPCLYHCTNYSVYAWRMVYSPALHLALNVRVERLAKRIAGRDIAFYQQLNDFRRVTFASAPNVIIVCIESYGSVVYRDARHGAGVGELLRLHETELTRAGYGVASTFSEAPLFAGGSWLSLASFAYGIAIDNLRLYELLFSRPSNFGAYESLFHVLRRNGYENVLLCPLGGVAPGIVDWDEVDRCFQPQVRIGFDDLGYVGPTVNYFGSLRLHAALDQFALNFAYERALERGRPFSLFFCTLNSHYPWHSTAVATDDWRTLNSPEVALDGEVRRPPIDRYNAAIRYQLDYVLRFAVDRATDAPLIVVFGDHQPPMITPDHMGKDTPIHVLSRDPSIIDTFLSHGFVRKLDLTDRRPRPTRHEGSLSLLMRAMHGAYGAEPGIDIPYRERGARIEDALQGAE